MPIVSFKVIPMGIGTSVSRYIARVVALLEERGYKPRVTPDTTILRINDLSEIGVITRMIHDELYSMGVQRIITVIMVDDRRDIEEREPEVLVKRVEELKEHEKKKMKDLHGVL
ncbi:MAG: thiamine-binding protein [Pyrodictiaceae archaeon]